MGWPRIGVAFLAGGASVLAYAPFELFPLAAVALGVLFWLLGPGAPEALRSASLRRRMRETIIPVFVRISSSPIAWPAMAGLVTS